MLCGMAQIEHDKNEPAIDRSNTVWWSALVVVLFSTVTYFLSQDPDWWAICLGLMAGVVLTGWAIEKTGNKIPDSWRKSTRRP